MFSLSLEISKSLEQSPQLNIIFDCNSQNDNIDAVIQELCEILEQTGVVKFKVAGFGQDNWPVDISVDLVSILEQFPEVIDSIYGSHYPFQLDFYEQGIQRRLEFEKEDEFIKITCYSGTSWLPNPRSITLTEKYILSQFLNFKDSFLQAAKKVCPQLSYSDLFSTWCTQHNRNSL